MHSSSLCQAPSANYAPASTILFGVLDAAQRVSRGLHIVVHTKEILVLWYMRKNRLQYKFKPFIWEVGGHFTYPDDKDKIEYHHTRGFEDVFTEDINLPFRAFL